MTSKETLNILLYGCNNHVGFKDFFKAREKIEKDLEILDILKNHYDNNSLALSLNSFIVFTIHNDDKDFHKIKEWLENE